jgi:outer membrane protein, heavy metal efflux system
MMRQISDWLSLSHRLTTVVVLLVCVTAAVAADDPTAEVTAYVSEALARNPGIKAATAAVAAAGERIPQATSLPDPRLGVSQFLEPVETRVGPQQRALSLSQSVPWFGTLSLRGEIERKRVDASRAERDDTILRVVSAVRTAYFEIAYLDEVIDITHRHIDLLADWEEVARARYETGVGSYADVIKSQVELGLLGNRLAELTDRRHPLWANLNALRDRSPGTTVTAHLPPTFTPFELDREALARRVLADNPGLRVWDHKHEQHVEAERLARKSGYPSFTLGLTYIQTGAARQAGVLDSGTDAMSASLAVNLPLWRGKYRSAVQEAAQRRSVASATRQDIGNTLVADLETAVFAYTDAARKHALYTSTLLPKARQSLSATRAAYETGESRFLDLVDAERVLLEFELALSRAHVDALIHQAEIDRLTAAPLADSTHLITPEVD